MHLPVQQWYRGEAVLIVVAPPPVICRHEYSTMYKG